MNDGLERFNQLPAEQAERDLLSCCDSLAWARALARQRPFADADALLGAADAEWWKLPATEWLRAFAAHPRIGERAAARPQHGEGDRWSAIEQAGATRADDTVKEALREVNQEYENRFGYTYIVFATGKSGAEMLQLARERLQHEDAQELRVAAAEQAKITRLRLQRLLDLKPGIKTP